MSYNPYDFAEESRVWYRQAIYGGYGYYRDVPAIFERIAGKGKRATIRVQLMNGRQKRICVKQDKLRKRERD